MNQYQASLPISCETFRRIRKDMQPQGPPMRSEEEDVAHIPELDENTELIHGTNFIRQLKRMGLVAPDIGTQRVIIDAKCDDVVKIYVQAIPDKRLLDLNLEAVVAGAEIEEPSE